MTLLRVSYCMGTCRRVIVFSHTVNSLGLGLAGLPPNAELQYWETTGWVVGSVCSPGSPVVGCEPELPHTHVTSRYETPKK